jgi:hypothetical protein
VSHKDAARVVGRVDLHLDGGREGLEHALERRQKEAVRLGFVLVVEDDVASHQIVPLA